MGFFDRFAGRKSNPTPPPTSATPTPVPTPVPSNAPLPVTSTTPLTPIAQVKAALIAAREKLEARDLPAAMAIYESLLAAHGDRPDVLVTISGDLGATGHIEPIVELIAPRYDAQRHGPATGLNLLQAYLVTRNTGAAQHLLDILFALQRPDLEQRLFGFSNALAELIEAERLGLVPPASAVSAGAPAPAPTGAPQGNVISLASISKPIWAYGIETLPGLLPAKSAKLRRVAFGQLATPGLPDFNERLKAPEDALGRFTRGFPLWLAETFYFSPHYAPIAAVGLLNQANYALFPGEWTPENIRQLVSTSSDPLDYVFTGALVQHGTETELTLRVWEVKKMKERKQFTARWTPATADAQLAQLHEQIRLFMEWQPCPAGSALAYAAPASPTRWIDTLGASLSLFFVEKKVLPRESLAVAPDTFALVAEQAGTGESASLAWLTLEHRARQQTVDTSAAAPTTLKETPLVAAARTQLG